MEELKTLVAFVFKRRNLKTMNEDDFYMMLSFELGWLTPGEGRMVIERAIETGLLQRDSDKLVPLFNHTDVEIPEDYRVSSEQLQCYMQDFTTKLISVIMEKTGSGQKKIMKEIEKTVDEHHIYKEIAALLVAKNHDVVIDTYFDEAWKIIKKKAKETSNGHDT